MLKMERMNEWDYKHDYKFYSGMFYQYPLIEPVIDVARSDHV